MKNKTRSVFLKIPVKSVTEDANYVETDTRQIYEHLKYFYSLPRIFPLPAIHVQLSGENISITRGRNYLRIARDLGDEWIRGILQYEATDSVDFFAGLPDGVEEIPREDMELEASAPVVRSWHVYFFESPLAGVEQALFLNRVAGFFERLETPFIAASEKRLFRSAFPFDGHCAQFEALIPVGDNSWFAAYREVSRNFSRDIRRIVSFQGARFVE